jgi:hypothetical protein
MTKEESHIARIKFQNRVFKSNGQAYEDFFTNIMQVSDNNFELVKAHGKEGDKKCDGFNKKTGQYYQVYAPEGLAKKEKIAQDKLDETIEGLFAYWQDITPIKEFFYVINDSYRGVWPEIHKQLAKIAGDYKINTSTFLSKDLEDVFLALPENEIVNILDGYLLSASNIVDIDISVLGEVIDYLMNFNLKQIDEKFPEKLDFNKKLTFNKLSSYYGQLLNTAFYQNYMVRDYFSLNSQFAKQDLKLIFSEFYSEALQNIPDNVETKSDIVFEYIWDKASPRNTKSMKEAVLVLMAHYFESCDIFEEPLEPKQQKLF